MEEPGQAQMMAKIFRQSEIDPRIPEDIRVNNSVFVLLVRAGLRSSEIVGLVLQESEAFR